MPILIELFLTFVRIGLFTFGGGYAMLSIIENICVEKKNWITHDEMMNVTVIAESTPGPIAINCATFVGYKVRRGGAGIGCHGKGVLQLQFIGLPAELHPLPAIHPVGFRDRAVAAPHGGAGAQQGRPGTGGGRRLEEFASFHTDIKYTKKKSRRQIAGGFG